MNSFTGFEPDPGLYDPEDEDGAYGYWTYDDGTRRYGKGDPEEARALMTKPATPSAPAPEPGQPPESIRRPDEGPPVSIQRPVEDDGKGDARSLNEALIRRAAVEAGLDPDKMAAVVAYESGFNPSARNKTSGATGFIQFMPETYAGMKKPPGWGNVEFEQLGDVDPAAQAALTVEYFKQKGITADSSPGDYYRAVAAPASLGKPREHVVYGAGSKAVEQNPAWDRNKDGVITAGELDDTVGGRGSVAQPTAPSAAPAPTSPLLQPPPGLAVSQVTQQGIPLSEAEIRGRQQRVLDSTQSLVQAQQAAAQGRVAGRQEVIDEVNRQSNERLQNAAVQQQHNEMLKAQATEKIQRELYTPIQQVDPNRLIRGMSTGDMLLGALAVAFDAMGATVQRYYGNPNAKPIAMQVIDQSISDDIARQKDAIDRGERSSQNRVAHWTRVFNDADSGLKAAKVEANEAVAMKLRASAMKTEQADIQAEMTTKAAELSAQGQQLADQIRDKEAAKLAVQYAPPKLAAPPMTGPIPVGPNGRGAVTPEQKQQLAREFMTLKPAEQRAQLDGIRNDTENINALKAARDELRRLYEVTPDANGNYPEYSVGSPYESGATGPVWNEENWEIFQNQRDRQLAKAWTTIKSAERMSWEAEPNGQTAQRMFEGVGVPDRDRDVPLMLRQLDDKIARMDRTNQGAWTPQAWAFYSLQNPDPGEPKPVQGRVQR